MKECDYIFIESTNDNEKIIIDPKNKIEINTHNHFKNLDNLFQFFNKYGYNKDLIEEKKHINLMKDLINYIVMLFGNIIKDKVSK